MSVIIQIADLTLYADGMDILGLNAGADVDGWVRFGWHSDVRKGAEAEEMVG